MHECDSSLTNAQCLVADVITACGNGKIWLSQDVTSLLYNYNWFTLLDQIGDFLDTLGLNLKRLLKKLGQKPK